MRKRFPHIHSFRLSDGDKRTLLALMQRFEIDFSKEHSSAFRLFLNRLSRFLKQLDADAKAKTIPEPSAAHWQPRSPWILESDEEEDEDEEEDSEWDKQMKILEENYRKVERLTVKALRKEGLRCTQENFDLKFQEIKKELGLKTSYHET